MSITVREAEISDLPQIVETHAASAQLAYKGHLSPKTIAATFSPEKLHDNWDNSFHARYTDPSIQERLLVAEQNNQIVGVARCHVITDVKEKAFLNDSMASPIYENYGEIQTLYVHPEHQGKQIGHALMSEMGKYLRSQNVTKSVVITLDGYDASANFYQRIGDATLAGQFELNTAACAGAANNDADLSKFNVWLFSDVSKFIDEPRHILTSNHARGILPIINEGRTCPTLA